VFLHDIEEDTSIYAHKEEQGSTLASLRASPTGRRISDVRNVQLCLFASTRGRHAVQGDRLRRVPPAVLTHFFSGDSVGYLQRSWPVPPAMAGGTGGGQVEVGVEAPMVGLWRPAWRGSGSTAGGLAGGTGQGWLEVPARSSSTRELPVLPFLSPIFEQKSTKSKGNDGIYG
jgi:hypothetical protein